MPSETPRRGNNLDSEMLRQISLKDTYASWHKYQYVALFLKNILNLPLHESFGEILFVKFTT